MECCTRRVAIFHRDIVLLKDNYKKVEINDSYISLRDLITNER
ncbi:hypothetical protein C6557_13130 [Bacillus wiedmannii]|nr:hypothetical protein C6557_13130 [Bacillus wiedmannii]